MNEDNLHRLIDGWLAGDLSAAEQRELEQALRHDPRAAEMAEALRAEVRAAHYAHDTDAAWRTLAARVGLPADHSVVTPRVRPRSGLLRAAAIVLLLGSAAIATIELGGRAAGDAQQAVAFVAQTRSAEVRHISLPDGSQIALAPASRLELAFDGQARHATLSGEAYFDVAPDAGRPFIVRTATSRTRVVGTRFDVRQYPDESLAQLVVLEGRVTFGDTVGLIQAPVLPGQRAELAPHGDISVMTLHETGIATAWMEAGLVFDAMPLREVAVALQRTYGLEVVLADSTILERPITARFQRMPVDDLLEAIALPLDLAVQRTGTRVTFSEKR